MYSLINRMNSEIFAGGELSRPERECKAKVSAWVETDQLEIPCELNFTEIQWVLAISTMASLRDLVTGSDACNPGDGAGPSNAFAGLANNILGTSSKDQERLREVRIPLSIYLLRVMLSIYCFHGQDT